MKRSDMPNDEARAEAMERGTGAVINAVGETCGTDLHVMMGSLGAAAGVLALATGEPDKFLDGLMAVARGVVSGTLMESALAQSIMVEK